jgi:tetratricopeptide (TPR) repeat protein
MATKEELIKEAKRLGDEKKYDEVIALLTDDLLEKHQSSTLYFRRAYSLVANKEYEKGIADYTKAIELDPIDITSYNNRGLAFERIKEYTKAIADYTKAIELNPIDAIYYNNRGDALYGKKEYDKAIADYTKAIDLNPEYVNAYSNRANVLHEQNKYDEAIADYTKVIELDSKDSDTYYNRAHSLYYKKEYDKSIADYTKAIELNPEFSAAYNNRGVLWKNKNEYNFAIADYIKAVELDSENLQALKNLGNIYYDRLKDYPKSIEYYDTVLKKAPDDTNIKLLRDEVLEKLKEQEELKKLAPYGEQIRKQFAIIDEQVKAILDLAKTDGKQPLVHYTKLFVAEKLLSVTDTKLRYYNALYMNDPSEGEIVFECFSGRNREAIKKSFDDGKLASEISVYLGSFLSNSKKEPHEDELVMWRTYGKDENKIEAAGCSLVIAPEFFEKEDGDTGKISLIDMKHALYKVIYASRGKLSKKDAGIKSSLAAIEQAIIQLENIKAKNIKKGKNPEVTPVVNRRIFESISKICHLFKSADYAFEHEVRVVKYVPLDSDIIQRDESTPKKLYIESANSIVPHIKKIFVGTKVTNPSHWKAYLDNLAKQRKREDKIDCKIEFHQSNQKFQ